jgi:hypothetical protein
MSSIQPFISPAITIISSMISIAVMWGVLKTNVDNMKSEVERLRGAVDRFAEFREDVRVFMGIQEAGKMSAAGGARKRRSKA